MPDQLATPAQLALHALHAILPRSAEVPASPVLFLGHPTVLTAREAAALLDAYPKPLNCGARARGGILEIEVSEATSPGLPEQSSEGLLVRAIRDRAELSGSHRVLVVGRGDVAVVTDVQRYVDFEHEYRLAGNHFVRIDPPSHAHERFDVSSVLTYYPSESHTDLRILQFPDGIS